ncbi:staphylopine biosynthesis dehydrogenase [Staphylococcus durrellii]|uniref:staphylopine biosynthesis dehydrogenase n=1 Tax=Staphylococcus durrellii TaxID=2781773 RepID=UPI00189EFDBB|nr:staphylopine biosynthesis dehydrogenase [Staphylococcus durrellii]MBF7015914.1 staphylopine biosynthesis dehydrogenase [Staphylococcus durrellii]
MSKILIIGTGPVAIQLANICYKYTDTIIDMVGRATTSTKSQRLFQAYKRDGYFEVMAQNAIHQHLTGQFQVNNLYGDLSQVKDEYDTVIMACTADAYHNVLRQLPTPTLENIKHIVLVSPTFGSHMIVEQFIMKFNKDIEVISYSTYIGDTRVINHMAPNRVLTTGVKTKIYMGSNHEFSEMTGYLKDLFQRLKIKMSVMASPLHAESRNSSLYLHPPLFMNDFSLTAVFDGTKVPVYIYKLFPEGPITMTLIHEMRLMWKEISTITQKLNVPTINLLEFMTKENYPVKAESIDKDNIENFETLPNILQEYLLYVRYSAILIDPFSKPDNKGRYFDFSAVPIQRVDQDEQQIIRIPRMPSEDYYRTAIIQHIAKLLGIATPMIDKFLQRYIERCQRYRLEHPDQRLSSQFDIELFKEDMDLITRFLEIKKIV